MLPKLFQAGFPRWTHRCGPFSEDTSKEEGRQAEEAVREQKARLRAEVEAATRARQAAEERAQRDEEERVAVLMTIFEATAATPPGGGSKSHPGGHPMGSQRPGWPRHA